MNWLNILGIIPFHCCAVVVLLLCFCAKFIGVYDYLDVDGCTLEYLRVSWFILETIFIQSRAI